MLDYGDMLIRLRTELANVRIREQQLIDAIGRLDRLHGQGATLPGPDDSRPFVDMTLGDAAAQLLATHGPLSTRDLAELLLNGGTRTSSRNFVGTLYTTLYKDSRFVLTDGKWRLRASAPAITTVVQ